jgi:hypothetical protein
LALQGEKISRKERTLKEVGHELLVKKAKQVGALFGGKCQTAERKAPEVRKAFSLKDGRVKKYERGG